MNIQPTTIRLLTLLILWCSTNLAKAQCSSSDIMEPGFNFITSSRGCAPFEIRIQTRYLASTPGTEYYINWGDGSPEELYTQVAPYPNGPEIVHTYPNSPTDCGYQITIDVENACNPRGSVVLEPIPVIIWTNDIVIIDPMDFRVCEGTDATVTFTDQSDWNCNPRADLRENNDSRWIQWEYGDPANGNRINNVLIDGINPGGFPYIPDPLPKYPVNAVGEQSLDVYVPNSAMAGEEFFVTLHNWNTCNAYDENLSDGNGLNPVTPGGDNAPLSAVGRILIVEAPTADFVTRKNNAAGAIASNFCINDNVYFDNESVGPAGSGLVYTWEIYNGPNDTYPFITYNNANPTHSFNSGGPKLIRLYVRDGNAVGNCEAFIEKTIHIAPTSIAQLNVSPANFCKEDGSSEVFIATFEDVSIGISANTQWKWEFEDENGNIIRQEPAPAIDLSDVKLGPFNQTYTREGVYKTRLYTYDRPTGCYTVDEKIVSVLLNPEPDFSNNTACDGLDTYFKDESTIRQISGNVINKWEWDFDYDGVTFSPEQTYDNSIDDSIVVSLPAGTYPIALRVTENQGSCSAIKIDTITVGDLPVADFNATPITGCSPLDVELTNTGHALQTEAMHKYSWYINNPGGNTDTISIDPNAVGFDPLFQRQFVNASDTIQNFDVSLGALTAFGCPSTSNVQQIEVLPSKLSGFTSLNYDPLGDNCSPINVEFSADVNTQLLNPQEYYWCVFLDTTLVDVDTIPGTDPGFIYEFSAAGNQVNQYNVVMKANVPGVCTTDSTRRIRVNPMPEVEILVDTIRYDCDSMILDVRVDPTNYSLYEWTIYENALITNFDDETQFEYKIKRPEPGFSAKNVEIQLRATNFALCDTDATPIDIQIPAKNSINTSFAAFPVDQTLPDSTVTITNTTNVGPWSYAWDFGDGTTFNQRDPIQHHYQEAGEYLISLTVSDGVCVEVDTQRIRINPHILMVDFDFDPIAGCVPLTVNFSNKSRFANESSYFWEFGDGATSVSKDPSYTYTTPGTYTVSLTAWNDYGDTITTVKPFLIQVKAYPEVDFEVSPLNQIYPSTTVEIINNSVTNIINPVYFWDFGDGNFSNVKNPESYTYDQPGDYMIKLNINEQGCEKRDSIAIRISTPPPPLVDFEFSPGSGCGSVTVNFVNLSVNVDTTSFIWDFGDGTSISFEKNPVHTYYETGTYTVSLKAANALGEFKETIKENIIEVKPIPEVRIDATPKVQEFPSATIALTDNSESFEGDYLWEFGDGTSSSDPLLRSHTYEVPGQFYVKLTIDSRGCLGADSVNVFIQPTKPIADFSATPLVGCSPLTVQFTNESKYEEAGTYKWFFGFEGNVSNLENPLFTYYEPGIYTVRLEVANSIGQTDVQVREQYIEVYPTPIASFDIRPERVKLLDEPIFTTNRSSDADFYDWYFGDGTTSIDFEPTHYYTEAGIYDIKLIAKNSFECADTAYLDRAVEVIKSNKVTVPNAFTPSTSGPTGGIIGGTRGSNDVFYPITEGVVKYQLQIFNRWGELLFNTTDRSMGWDGYYNGKLCPPDVYVYRLNIKYIDGNEEVVIGDVTLLK